MSSGVSVVTCYYNIKSKFTNSKYMGWIKNFMKLECNCIIYGDMDSIRSIKSICDPSSNNFTFIELPIHDFNMSKEPYNEQYWENECKKDDEIKRGISHSISLYKIWNEKIYFMDRSAKLNPYNSEYFLWVDIGSFRDSKRMQEINSYKFATPDNFIKGKMTLFQIGSFTNKEIDNFKIDDRFKNVNRLGGLFGGDSDSIFIFKDKHSKILSKFKLNGIFSGKDQSLYNYIALLYPNLVNVIDAYSVNPTYDPWFCFHYYF